MVVVEKTSLVEVQELMKINKSQFNITWKVLDSMKLDNLYAKIICFNSSSLELPQELVTCQASPALLYSGSTTITIEDCGPDSQANLTVFRHLNTHLLEEYVHPLTSLGHCCSG